jgi:hypothetical protein
MISTPHGNRITSLTSDEILYHYYSYDWLHYTIDLFKSFYEKYKITAYNKDPSFDKKCSVLKFEIVAKFCHYAEVLGAFIYPCHKVNPDLSSANILENLSKYNIRDIDEFYSAFDTRYTLDTTKRNNFKKLFGYDQITSGQGADKFIDSSLINIVKVLNTIGEFYGFWKYSYNAYKHGYRLWFGDEYEHKLNVVSYLKKYSKLSQQNDLDHLPIDDKTINDIHNMSYSLKYCCSIKSS